MAESPEMIAAVLTSALLRNSGLKETKLAIEKYISVLEMVKAHVPAYAAAKHAAPAPAPAPAPVPEEAEPVPTE